MGDLKQIFLYLFQLLHVALLFGIPLTDLLNFSSLYLNHFILHLYLLLVIWRVKWPLPAFSLPIDVAVLGEGHFLLALYHFVVFVECYKLAVAEIGILTQLCSPEGARCLR
jgi:hypothetical protein